MSDHFRTTTSLLAFALGAFMASGPATAITQIHTFSQNATGACQSALPVYDGQIRKRPLALQNEGTGSAFVSCSFTGDVGAVGGVRSTDQVSIFIDNNTASPVDVTCTLVDGLSGIVSPSPVYIPKTTSLAANAKFQYLSWSPSDNGGQNFFYTTNVSCNLPVGVGLSFGLSRYVLDIGN